MRIVKKQLEIIFAFAIHGISQIENFTIWRYRAAQGVFFRGPGDADTPVASERLQPRPRCGIGSTFAFCKSSLRPPGRRANLLAKARAMRRKKREKNKSTHFPVQSSALRLPQVRDAAKVSHSDGEAKAVSAPDVSRRAAKEGGEKNCQQRETQNSLNPGTSATPCPSFPCQTRLGMRARVCLTFRASV